MPHTPSRTSPSDASERPAQSVVPEVSEHCAHCAHCARGGRQHARGLRRRLAGVFASSLVLLVLLVAGGYFMFDGAGYPAALRARFVHSCGLPGACRCLLEHLETQGVPAASVASFLEGDLSRSTSVFSEMKGGLFICGVAPGSDAHVSRTGAALQSAADAQAAFAQSHGKFTYEVGDLVENGLRVNREIELDVLRAGYMSYCIEAHHEQLDAMYFLDSTRGSPAAGNC